MYRSRSGLRASSSPSAVARQYTAQSVSQGVDTCVHGSKHAGNELVNAIALSYERSKGRYATFVVGTASEACEYEFLKCFYLVL